jgi:hypothetical protein
MHINRRGLIALGTSVLAAPAVAGVVADTAGVQSAIDRFAALPA